MGLSDTKEAELKNMPKVEFIARKSKDGKYMIHKTVFTDIKPIAYYEKVLASDAEVTSDSTTESQEKIEA